MPWPVRIIFLLIISVAWISGVAAQAAAPTLERTPLPSGPCEISFTAEGYLPAYADSIEGQALFRRLKSIEKLLPTDLDEFARQLAPNRDISVATLARAIAETRDQQASELRKLASRTGRAVFKDAFERTAFRVEIGAMRWPEYRDLFSSQWQSVSYAEFHERLAGPYPPRNLTETHRVFLKLIGSHGFFAELRVAFQLPGVVGIGVRLNEILTLEERARFRDSLSDPTLTDSILDRAEVDILYDGGKKWLEVKNSRIPFTRKSVVNLMSSQLMLLELAAHIIEPRRNYPITRQALFLRGGLNEEATEFLRAIGVEAFTSDRLPWETTIH